SNDLKRILSWLPGASDPKTLLAWCLAGMVLIHLLATGLAVASSLADIAFGRQMVCDLAADLFSKMLRQSLQFHRRSPIGDSIRRLTTDCNCVSTIVTDALLPVVSATLGLAMMFAVMWRLNHPLTLLALVVVPYMVFVLRRLAKPMFERGYEQQEI